jgi:transcriptional regulator
MYDLPYHKEKNQLVIKEFIGKYPFALLTGCDAENEPVVTQIPVFIEEANSRIILRGHIMKKTDHHKAFLHNQNVLVVFTGHHTYISGTWYSNPYTPSTWNYMSVHVKGSIRFLDDNELIDTLRMTTLHFENYNQKSTTIYDNLPSDYTQKLMKAIVAFEIEVKEMDTVFKLSQDRDAESYNNIIKRLKLQGESGQMIASEMEKRTRELFPDNKEQNC